jgi:hypothetical protein
MHAAHVTTPLSLSRPSLPPALPCRRASGSRQHRRQQAVQLLCSAATPRTRTRPACGHRRVRCHSGEEGGTEQGGGGEETQSRPPTPPAAPTPPPPGDDDPATTVEAVLRSISLQRFLSYLVELGGVKGTAAVGAAFVLKLDLFASFSLDAHDVALAYALAVPILLVDAVLMAPDWSQAPDVDTAAVELATSLPGDVLPLPAADAALPPVPSDVGAWRQFVEAASLFQTIKVRANPGQGLSSAQELALIVVGHVADEMLARGVLLGVAALWVRDRLYEADGLTYWSESTNDAAAPALALGAIIAFEALRKWRSLSRNLGVQAALVGKDKVTGRTKVTTLDANTLMDGECPPPRVLRPSTSSAIDIHLFPTVGSNATLQRNLSQPSPERLAAIQAQVQAARSRAATVAQIESIRSLLDWAAYGGAFVLSHGNLLGPIVASTSVDALFSGYQRAGAVRLAAKNLARVEAATAAMRAKVAAAGGLAADGQDAGAAPSEQEAGGDGGSDA